MTYEIAALPKGLEKVSGYSVEQVLSFLEQRAKKTLKVNSQYLGRQLFFRDHSVRVAPSEIPKIGIMLDEELEAEMINLGTNGFQIEARYKPRNFDYSSLDGLIFFDNGLLVERTFVHQYTQHDLIDENLNIVDEIL